MQHDIKLVFFIVTPSTITATVNKSLRNIAILIFYIF